MNKSSLTVYPDRICPKCSGRGATDRGPCMKCLIRLVEQRIKRKVK